MNVILRSATLFSSDGCRKAILDSLNMAWTQDKYKNVEDKYKMKEKWEKTLYLLFKWIFILTRILIIIVEETQK